MRHQRSEAAVGCGDGGEAARAAVRVERVSLGRSAEVVDETQGAMNCRGVAAL